METELFKIFASLGGPGIMAWILWLISKRFMDAHATQVLVTQAAQNNRIDALEKAQTECEADRRRMHGELVQVLREVKYPQMHRPVTAPKEKCNEA